MSVNNIYQRGIELTIVDEKAGDKCPLKERLRVASIDPSDDDPMNHAASLNSPVNYTNQAIANCKKYDCGKCRKGIGWIFNKLNKDCALDKQDIQVSAQILPEENHPTTKGTTTLNVRNGKTGRLI